MKKDRNGSDNELNWSAFSGTCFIYGKRGHTSNKYTKADSSSIGNDKYSKFTGNYSMRVKK